MKYKVETETDEDWAVIGTADSRYGARKIIIEHAKTIIGDVHVAALTYDLVTNSTIKAITEERITHIREDWEGNWTLIWFNDPPLSQCEYQIRDGKTVLVGPNGPFIEKDDGGCHSKFFFVFEQEDDV